MKNMKRIIYIALTMVLGLLLSFFLHFALEMPALNYLVEGGLYTGSLPLWTLNEWLPIHRTTTLVIALGGLVGGWFLGRSWWHTVYEERRIVGR